MADLWGTEPTAEPEKIIVVVPVKWGQLSKETFLWYLNTLYLNSHCVHVCHVPDFRRHLQPGLTPEEVMEIMIETNTESELLKKLYEDFIAERQIDGKFVRVGGNNRWFAIVEYCKRMNAVLLVLGTQPRQLAVGPKQQQNNPKSQQEQQKSPTDQQEQQKSPTDQQEQENSTEGDQQQQNNPKGFYKPDQLLRLCKKNSRESWVSNLSADAPFREAALKIFHDSLIDQGPFAGTVTQDVLEQCVSCSIVVYRRPEAKASEAQRRMISNMLRRGSFNANTIKLSR